MQVSRTYTLWVNAESEDQAEGLAEEHEDLDSCPRSEDTTTIAEEIGIAVDDAEVGVL